MPATVLDDVLERLNQDQQFERFPSIVSWRKQQRFNRLFAIRHQYCEKILKGINEPYDFNRVEDEGIRGAFCLGRTVNPYFSDMETHRLSAYHNLKELISWDAFEDTAQYYEGIIRFLEKPLDPNKAPLVMSRFLHGWIAGFLHGVSSYVDSMYQMVRETTSPYLSDTASRGEIAKMILRNPDGSPYPGPDARTRQVLSRYLSDHFRNTQVAIMTSEMRNSYTHRKPWNEITYEELPSMFKSSVNTLVFQTNTKGVIPVVETLIEIYSFHLYGAATTHRYCLESQLERGVRNSPEDIVVATLGAEPPKRLVLPMCPPGWKDV